MVRTKGSKNSLHTRKNNDKLYELRPKTSFASDLFASITQGFGFGAGSSIARSIFGGNKIEIENKDNSNEKNFTSQVCEREKNLYRECLIRDVFVCTELHKNYEDCVRNTK
jgi:hypothetical protein